MPKFEVVMRDTVDHTYIVEAETQEDAASIAYLDDFENDPVHTEQVTYAIESIKQSKTSQKA